LKRAFFVYITVTEMNSREGMIYCSVLF